MGLAGRKLRGGQDVEGRISKGKGGVDRNTISAAHTLGRQIHWLACAGSVKMMMMMMMMMMMI
jgi:hypothetical protein